MNRLANRRSKDEQSHIMLLKTILLALPLVLTTPPMVVSQEREIYISMQQYDRTIDHIHRAVCVHRPWIFAKFLQLPQRQNGRHLHR
jgi:hypothetical protein